jgi:hypothetical protein
MLRANMPWLKCLRPIKGGIRSGRIRCIIKVIDAETTQKANGGLVKFRTHAAQP